MSNYWARTLSARIGRRRAIVAGGTLAASAAFLAACGNGDDEGGSSSTGSGGSGAAGLLTVPVDTTKEAKKGGVLKRNTNADGSLDPNVSQGQTSPFLELVYTRLIGWKPGHNAPAAEDAIVGDSAESWEYSPDRLTITMKLRNNVKFHNLPPVNGRLMDAEDVAFSWNRFATIGSSRGAIANVANPNAPILSVTATDKSTVVIKLKDPVAYALSYFGGREQVNLMPKEAADPAVLDLKGKHLGAGPFYLDRYEPSVGFTFRKHADFWDKDNVYVDQIEYPIIPEYATGLAQLRSGNLHVMGGFGITAAGSASVTPEDVVQVKKDVPKIGLYDMDVQAAATRLVFGRRTPELRDERVRLAFQLSYDRDTWIDTVLNAENYEKEGLEVQRRWYSAFPEVSAAFDGWRLEPSDPKSIGDAAKYYKYDIAEAKKLLSAAGFPNGIEVKSTYYPTAGTEQIAARQGMNNEAGIRFQDNVIDYATEFIPKYRDVQGDFEGIIYRGTIVISADPVDRMSQLYWSKSGFAFYGFDVNGTGDGSGDPYVDQTLEKAQRETDVNKAKALINDLDRYLAPKAYAQNAIAGSTAFAIAWPVIGNFQVWRGSYHSNVRTPSTHWWIDDTKPPIGQG